MNEQEIFVVDQDELGRNWAPDDFMQDEPEDEEEFLGCWED